MLILARLALTFAALLPGGEDPKKPAFEIALKPTAAVRGLHVTIGDLAEITPANGESLAIAQLRFGPAPVQGHTRTVSRMDVLQSIVASGRAAADFQWKGAGEALLQALVVDVQPADMLDAATTALQAVLALDPNRDVEFESAAKPRVVQAPPGNRSQELRARVRGAVAGVTSAVVDVDILVDGESFRAVPITFKLTRFQQVLKTTGSVRQGTPLGAENTSLVREKIAQATGMWIGSLEQVQGLVARRNLPAGQLLTIGDLAPPALIHAGELVTVVLTRGNVKVSMRAVANHDAALGEPVTLTNPASRAQIQAIAAAAGTVVVPTGK